MQQQNMSDIVVSCSLYLLYLIRYVKNIFITKYFLLLYFWASYLFSKADITKRYFDFIFYARTILTKKQVKHQLPFILIFRRINNIVSMNTMFEYRISSITTSLIGLVSRITFPNRHFYINRCMAAKNNHGEIWFCLSSIKIPSKTISIISNVKGIIKLDQMCTYIIQSQFDCMGLLHILRPFLTNGFWTSFAVNLCYVLS